MKIVNLEPYGYSEVAIRKFIEAGCDYIESTWSKVRRQEHLDAAVLIVRLSTKVGRAELDNFPRLQYLLSATTGLDHIDLSVITQREIRLISLRGENDFLKTIPSTAEHTWALLLSLVRNIPSAVAAVGCGAWNRDAFRGYQLKDKRIGIIGFGRTGQKVASYAKAFGMEVLYYDPYVESSEYFRFEKLDDLLAVSDVVSVHVHLNAATQKMLNGQNIRIIKKGAIVINTSRGGIWDEYSMSEALVNGTVAGVATDVLSTELEDIKLSPLWKAMNEGRRVIITPHLGGATWDAMWACEEFIADRFLNIRVV